MDVDYRLAGGIEEIQRLNIKKGVFALANHGFVPFCGNLDHKNPTLIINGPLMTKCWVEDLRKVFMHTRTWPENWSFDIAHNFLRDAEMQVFFHFPKF